ncbi:MAG: VOC family protein [Clostridia bacterium]|nr:VOC family protein [Clostridia bacterium]
MSQLNAKLGIHHIALRVKDYDASFRFYTEVLGLKFFTSWTTAAGAKVALLDTGNNRFIELFSDGTDAAEENQRFTHISFRTVDVNAAYEAAIAGGATSIMEPSEKKIDASPVRIKIKCAFVRGPGGETIEFFHMERRGTEYANGMGW